jgi:hypothetical protein
MVEQHTNIQFVTSSKSKQRLLITTNHSRHSSEQLAMGINSPRVLKKSELPQPKIPKINLQALQK